MTHLLQGSIWICYDKVIYISSLSTMVKNIEYMQMPQGNGSTCTMNIYFSFFKRNIKGKLAEVNVVNLRTKMPISKAKFPSVKSYFIFQSTFKTIGNVPINCNFLDNSFFGNCHYFFFLCRFTFFKCVYHNDWSKLVF